MPKNTCQNLSAELLLMTLILICFDFLCRQYITNVGAEERYNIKELITSKNSVVPYLTEQDILEVCFAQLASIFI